MIFEKTDALSSLLQNKLLEAWNSEYPLVLNHDSNSFEKYLNSLANLQHTVVKDDKQNFCAWYFEFDRNQERQFGIIVHQDFQNKGLGKKLLERAKKQNNSLFAWVVDSNEYVKLDGSPYTSPLNFYLKNGFLIEPERWDSEKIKTVKISWHK
jgi:GNAT superfamily N-acetyltransferase